jgi:hypothetical protein
LDQGLSLDIGQASKGLKLTPEESDEALQLLIEWAELRSNQGLLLSLGVGPGLGSKVQTLLQLEALADVSVIVLEASLSLKTFLENPTKRLGQVSALKIRLSLSEPESAWSILDESPVSKEPISRILSLVSNLGRTVDKAPPIRSFG